MDPQGFPIDADPCPELGPPADDGFVRHLDGWFAGLGITVERQQAGVSECLDDVTRVGVIAELGAGDATSGVDGSFTDGDEPREEPPRRFLLIEAHRVDELVGTSRESSHDSADVVVGSSGEGGVGASFVQLGERILKRGQGGFVVGHVSKDLGHESGSRSTPTLRAGATMACSSSSGARGVMVTAEALVSSANTPEVRGRS